MKKNTFLHLVTILFSLHLLSQSLFAQSATSDMQNKLCGFQQPVVESTKNKTNIPVATKRAVIRHATKKDYAGNVLSDAFYFRRSLLTPSQQKGYDDVYNKLASGATVVVPSVRILASDVSDIFLAIVFDNPDLFWLNGGCPYNYNGDGSITQITFTSLKIDNFQTAIKNFEAKAEPILYYASKLKNDMQKIKYVHDYLCNTITYTHDTTGQCYDQTTYSSIMDGRTVCTGYAKAFCYFMQKLDIPTTLLIGSGHAWNMVKVNGAYYEMDVTWDDGITQPNYFNLTHAEMRKVESHQPDDRTAKIINAFPSTSSAMAYKNIYGSTPIGVPYAYTELAHFNKNSATQIALNGKDPFAPTTTKPTTDTTKPTAIADTTKPTATTDTAKPTATTTKPTATTNTTKPTATADTTKPTATTTKPTAIADTSKPTATTTKPTATTDTTKPTATTTKPTATTDTTKPTATTDTTKPTPTTDTTKPTTNTTKPTADDIINSAIALLDDDEDYSYKPPKPTSDDKPSDATTNYLDDEDYSYKPPKPTSDDEPADATTNYLDDEDYSYKPPKPTSDDNETTPVAENKTPSADAVGDWKSFVNQAQKKVAATKVADDTITISIPLKSSQMLEIINENIDFIWQDLDKWMAKRNLAAYDIDTNFSMTNSNMIYTLIIFVSKD